MRLLSSFRNSFLRSPQTRRRRPPLEPAPRRLAFETCEPRNLLASDIAVVAFDADGQNPVVHYDITGDHVSSFTIAIYAAPEGSSTGTMIGFKTVTNAADLAAGTGHA